MEMGWPGGIPDLGWPSWAHPVVCSGKLYIRNQGALACYEIKAL